MFRYIPKKDSFRYKVATFVEYILTSLGMKSLSLQFLFSYIVMTILTVSITALAYFELEAQIQTLAAIQSVTPAITDSIASAESTQSWLIFTSIALILMLICGREFGLTVLMRQIKNLRDHLRILTEHDFSQSIEVTNPNNEIGQNYQAYNGIIQEVGELLHKSTMVAGRINTSADQVMTTLSDTNRGVKEQELKIDSVVTAITEMSATIQQVAQSAVQASGSAQTANETAQHGHQIIFKTVNQIDQVAQQITSSEQIITSLATDSSEVGQVLDVITSIAEQTNLLALNAAIEAARAGESGRGFAVVADEVRNLAKRTQESTESIQAIIQRLQSGSEKAVNSIKDSCEAAKQTTEEAKQASHALEQIVQEVGVIRDMNSQIATAAEEQSVVAQNIDRDINDISVISNRTSEYSEQTVKATEFISKYVDNLVEEMAKFETSVEGLDLGAAKSAHLSWKIKLRQYLDGKATLSLQEAVSHTDCAFGKWFYSDGLKNYQSIPEMKAIEKPHEELHKLVKEAITMQENKDFQGAELAYDKVSAISADIVEKLNIIEDKVQHN